jgi:hypothetical protein
MKTIAYINQTPTAFLSAGTDRGCLLPVAGEAGNRFDFPVRGEFLSRTMCIRSEPFLMVSAGNGEGQLDNGTKRTKRHIPFDYGLFSGWK